MVTIKIKNKEIGEALVDKPLTFPLYTSQIINLANQNAQGTRPKVVGQMSDLIQEFRGGGYDEWVTFYQERMPHAIDDATDKIYVMVEKLKDAIKNVDKALVRAWVEDLVITKTFAGLCFQGVILMKIAELKNQPYRLATPEEESLGIDGYIGDRPVSVKPVTYKTMNALPESIRVDIIYYSKGKDGIEVEFSF